MRPRPPISQTQVHWNGCEVMCAILHTVTLHKLGAIDGPFNVISFTSVPLSVLSTVWQWWASSLSQWWRYIYTHELLILVTHLTEGKFTTITKPWCIAHDIGKHMADKHLKGHWISYVSKLTVTTSNPAYAIVFQWLYYGYFCSHGIRIDQFKQLFCNICLC